MQEPYHSRASNERSVAEEPLDLTSRLYDESHQNVYKRVQPRSGFSIMTSSIRDKSFAESYDNGISPLSHVEQYTYDLHKKRSSGVTVWEYDAGAPDPADAPPTQPSTQPPAETTTAATATPEEIPPPDVLNEHAKQAFAALEAMSIEPTFENLYLELKKRKLSETVVAYILDNMMMHNIMRSLKEQQIAVTDESMKDEMGKKEINAGIRDRVLRRFAAWKEASKVGGT
jgi:hypothetical protein